MTDYQGRSGEALAYANRMYQGCADLDHETDEWLYWARCLEDFVAGQRHAEAETAGEIASWLCHIYTTPVPGTEYMHWATAIADLAEAIERGDWKQP